jgi:hypothetical protein
MRQSLLALVLTASMLSGCLSAPERRDPFADLGVGAAALGRYKNIKVAVVVSNNTNELIQYMGSVNAHRARHRYSGVKLDPELLVSNLLEPLRRHFKEVVTVQSLGEAATAGADAAVVLDCYAKIRSDAFSSTTFDLNLFFTTPTGDAIDEVHAAGASQVPFQNIGHATLYEAAGEARNKATAAFVSSQKLQEFSVRIGGGVAAAPSAKPAAPVKTYSSEIDRPGYQAPERPDDFAVVIGVEKYQNLPSADFAERDAATMKDHLIALGYPSRNVVLLTGADAGRAGIEKYIESWLPRNVRESSTVFVYFSGHGSPDVSSGSAYLVPWDGDPKFLENTGYPLKRLFDKLNGLTAKNVLVAMDSCFSGAGGRSVLAKGMRPLVAKIDAGASAVGRLVVFSASGPDEVTGADEINGHGLFTYHFLKALQQSKGEARVSEIYAALKPRVQDAARRDNREQTPGLLPESLGASSNLTFR